MIVPGEIAITGTTAIAPYVATFTIEHGLTALAATTYEIVGTALVSAVAIELYRVLPIVSWTVNVP